MNDARRRLREYARGLAGGILFGLPILTTQEVWQQGFLIPPWRLGVFLLVQFFLLIGYVYFAGFRQEYTALGLAWEAVEALGLSFVVSGVFLFLVGQLGPGASLGEASGKILLATLPVSVGVALATVELGEKRDEDKRRVKEAGLVGHAVVSLGGAVYFAYNFASTDEIMMIAYAIDWWQAVLLMFASFFVGYGIVFYAGFHGGGLVQGDSWLVRSAWAQAITGYALALVTAVVVLFLIGRIALGDTTAAIVYPTVVLGFPAYMGAAAGRLII